MKRLYLLLISIIGLAFSQNASLDILYNQDDNSVDVYLQNDAPLSGFQFLVTGVSIESIGEGGASEYGFTVVSSGDGLVLGFNPSNTEPIDLILSAFEKWINSLFIKSPTVILSSV